MKSITLTQDKLNKLQAKLTAANKTNQKVKLVVKNNGIGVAVGKF